MKTLKIDIPEGMEIDIAKCILHKNKSIIFFKPLPITYNDIIKHSLYPCFLGIETFNDIQLLKLNAFNQLMNIAKFYNSKRVKGKDKYFIVYNTSQHSNAEYKICNHITVDYYLPYFYNLNDAAEVMNNPNFKEILDLLYKNNQS